MMKPQKLGRNVRMSFAKIGEALEMPNLIEVQKKSYEWFLKEGLKEVLDDVSPIVDYSGNLAIEFVDYTIDKTPKYPVEECKERDVNYAVPLRVTVRLTNKATDEIKEQEIYMGDFPLMTDNGTFVINGAERVVVSQIVRSPGIYYEKNRDKTGKYSYATTVIPYRGAWLEYETDANDMFYVRIDKNRKMPITVFLRALGLGSDSEIIEKFGNDEILKITMEKDMMNAAAEAEGCSPYEESLKEIYRKLRPGDPPLVESAQILINNLFFDARRYDISTVGRYKFNKKLSLARRINGKTLASDAVSKLTGEVILEKGTVMDLEKAEKLDEAGVCEVEILTDDGVARKVFSNGMVDLKKTTGIDLTAEGIRERVCLDVLLEIMESTKSKKELEAQILARKNDLIPKHITRDDIYASVNYLVCLANGIGQDDDIDHLGNRRLRCVGELLQNQLRIGFSRMDKIVRERMTIQDTEAITPHNLVNIRPVVSSIKEFFGSSPLSQLSLIHI